MADRCDICKQELDSYRFRQWFIPERMMGGLHRYLVHRIVPGDFLTAVIQNDFVEACGRADDENLANLPAYAAFFYNEAPLGSSGSKQIMVEWLRRSVTEEKKD